MFVAGTAMEVMGQQQADKDQQAALETNASFFREQADFIKTAGARTLSIFERKAAQLESSQIESYARSAVEFSGSAVQVVARDRQLASRESSAIQFDTDMRVRTAMFRAQDAENQARAISDTSQTRAFTTILSSGAQAASAFGGKK